jgi:hypothetical protein
LAGVVGACQDSDAVAAAQLVANACPIAVSRPAHRGSRVVETRTPDAVKRHREHIYDNGRSDIGVSIEAVPGYGEITEVDKLLFVLHGRLTYSYRDVAIESVAALLANYDLSLSIDSVIVAGRVTHRLDFNPKAPSGLHMAVRFDIVSGLALEVVRFDAANQPVYVMQYESVELDPGSRVRTDPPTLPDPPQKLTLTDLPAGTVVLSPGSTPEGFSQSERFATAIAPNGHTQYYVVDRFSDGLQQMFVVQGDGSLLLNSPPAADVTGGPPTFTTTQVGTVQVVWGRHEGQSVAAFGPFDRQILGELILTYGFAGR